MTATVGGYGASMYDASQWGELEERQVTLANVRGIDTDEADSDGGFTVTPEYLGVSYDGSGGEADAGDSRVGGEEGNPTGQAPQSSENDAHWGSFPSDFVDFQDETGQFSYWFTSGGHGIRTSPPNRSPWPSPTTTTPDPATTRARAEAAPPQREPATAHRVPVRVPGARPRERAAPAAGPASGSGAPDGASDPSAADFDEDRSAFSDMAQQAAGDSSLPTRAIVIGGITAGAGLAATITSVVYFRRRLGLDPRMFV